MIARRILVILVSAFSIVDGTQTISAAVSAILNELPSFSESYKKEADRAVASVDDSTGKAPVSQSAGLTLRPRRADAMREAEELVTEKRKELEDAKERMTHLEAVDEAVRQQILADREVAEGRQRKIEEKFTQAIEEVKAKAHDEESASKLTLVQSEQRESERKDAQMQTMAEVVKSMKDIMSVTQSLSKQQDVIKEKLAQTEQNEARLIDRNRKIMLALHADQRTQNSLSADLESLHRAAKDWVELPRTAEDLATLATQSNENAKHALTTIAADVKALKQETSGIGEVMQRVASSIT